MTQVGIEKQELLFEITAARISDDSEEKKHVIYTLQIRHLSGKDDCVPAAIERRYTHFYNLYMALKKNHPDLMTAISFPKKVLIGNFDNKLISTRSTGFECLLKYIATESQLRTSPALLSFLQDIEVDKTKKLLYDKQYTFALPLLENNFRLLNKVFTDRTPAVILALCKLLGCCLAIPGSPNAQKWADLALHRYEGVSDSDLLELYIPLLHVCIKVWWQIGRNKETLEQRLKNLRQQGIQINENITLLEAVAKVEKKMYDSYKS